jgi:hypothetical protein
MKKLIATLTAALVCLGAFAQGKIGFQNDSNHLVYYGIGTPYEGQAVYNGNEPPGVTFMADLYMGTTAGTLSLVSSTTFGAAPGKWNATSVRAPYPGGTSVFIEVQLRDSNSVPPPIFTGFPYGTWWAVSQEFTFTLGSSITYPVMWGANGNWPVGSQPLAGGLGAIGFVWIPEPSTFALAGLGAAALLIFRGRK